MKTRRRVMGVAVVVLGLVALVGEASAQGGPVITLEESVLKGRIQKPEAFYILQHAQLDYETLEAKPSFMEEVVESVEEEPF